MARRKTYKKRTSTIKNRWIKTKTLGRNVFKNSNRKARYTIKQVLKTRINYFKSYRDFTRNIGKSFLK